MATVFIQRRKRKGRYSYVVFYKDPVTRKNKYYKTYSRSKDARQAANDLRTLIDSGGIAKVERRKLRLNPLTFSEVSEYQTGRTSLRPRSSVRRRTTSMSSHLLLLTGLTAAAFFAR
jgi:hypothetical protein